MESRLGRALRAQGCKGPPFRRALFLLAARAAETVTYVDRSYDAGSGTVKEVTKTESATRITASSSSTWGAGWYVVNGNVTISSRIQVSGDVHLILADGCTLTAEEGINVAAGNSLTIYGQSKGTGALTAKSSNNGAGIGGDYGGDGSNITINGGTVTATSYNGAGIGGGYHGDGTNITINGGTVTATSTFSGAGIGGGDGAMNSFPEYGNGGNGRNININGGTVTATGGDSGAAIGGGYSAKDAKDNSITITGGTVTATGGENGGAGIGGGYSAKDVNNSITIQGGFVTAQGGSSDGSHHSGAPIGNGGTSNDDGAEFSGTFSNCVVLKQRGNETDMTGTVHGHPTLTEDAIVPSNARLTVTESTTLTLNATLTVSGTLEVEGTLNGSGTIKVDGEFKQGANVSVRCVLYKLTVEGGTANKSGDAGTLEDASGTDSSKKYYYAASRTELTFTAKDVPPYHHTTWKVENGDTYSNPYTMPASVQTVTLGTAPDEYTVTLYANGGQFTDNSQSPKTINYTYGKSLLLPSDETVTRDGYAFGGWYGNADGTGTRVEQITNTDTGNKTYYAKWNEKYSITYDLKGGVDPSNPGEYTVETETFTLVNPEREGYDFAGWSGTGLDGEDNQSVTIQKGSTGDRTYTAHWTGKSYKATLDAKGDQFADGAGTTTTTYTYGNGEALPDVTRDGYTFAGWCNSADGSGVSTFDEGGPKDKTFYASWTANKYTVTLHANGGTFANGSDTISYTYTYADDSTVQPLPTKDEMTYAGHTFLDWYDEKDSPVETVSSKVAGSQEYFAKWDANAYTVTLHLNNGEADRVLGYDYGDVVALPVDIAYTGHTFLGWYEMSDPTTPVTGIAATDMGDKEYEAKWELTPYTVTLEAEFGTATASALSRGVVTEQTTATMGTTILLTATPDKGFLFKEWQVVSGNVTIRENTFVMPAGDVVIKAVFERPAPPPQTGDNAHPGWWLFTACAALAGLGAAAAHGRKRRAGKAR